MGFNHCTSRKACQRGANDFVVGATCAFPSHASVFRQTGKGVVEDFALSKMHHLHYTLCSRKGGTQVLYTGFVGMTGDSEPFVN